MPAWRFLIPLGAAFLVTSPVSAETTIERSCFADLTVCGDLPDEEPISEVTAPAPNRVRTVLELGAMLGLAGSWYWIDRDRQVADWDFPSLRDRFRRDTYINDHNSFAINYGWHTFGGTAFHVAGRSNGLGLWESAAFGLGTSLAWEYGIEYREKISLNDIIFTTGAGMAMGELVHRLGQLLQQEFPGPGGEVARWTVGLPHSLHARLDGRNGAAGARVQHQFRFSSGVGLADATRRLDAPEDGEWGSGHLRLEARLVALDDRLRPGRTHAVFLDGNVTTLEAWLGAGPSGSGTMVLADTMLLGIRHERAPDAERVSAALTLGSSVGVRYQREEYDVWHDRLGALHLPGLAFDGSISGGDWTLRASGRLHGDYAGIHALNYPRWAAANPDARGKTVLAREGYYYGWGWSGRLAAELSVSWFSAGVRTFHGRYHSQQNFDRHQPELTVDQLVRDRRTDREVWLRSALAGRWFFEARRSTHQRSEAFEELHGSARMRRNTVELGVFF